MNRLTGAEAFVRMLELHGVSHVVGLCGDTSLPLYDALYRLDHGVLTRDERSAAGGATRIVHIDVEPTVIGANYATEAALIGDARLCLAALRAEIARRLDGPPAAIGAHFGRPGVKCVCVCGVGSFGFSLGELETMVRLDLPVTVVVLSNAGFGWIKAGQKSGFDGRYFSVDFGRTDHARGGRGVRGPGLARHRPCRAGAQVAVDGPSLVDVITQPLQEAHAPVSE